LHRCRKFPGRPICLNAISHVLSCAPTKTRERQTGRKPGTQSDGPLGAAAPPNVERVLCGVSRSRHSTPGSVADLEQRTARRTQLDQTPTQAPDTERVDLETGEFTYVWSSVLGPTGLRPCVMEAGEHCTGARDADLQARTSADRRDNDCRDLAAPSGVAMERGASEWGRRVRVRGGGGSGTLWGLSVWPSIGGDARRLGLWGHPNVCAPGNSGLRTGPIAGGVFWPS